MERIIVSTDSEQIAKIAKDYGAEVPFLRPPDLAADDTTRFQVVRHATTFLVDRQKYQPDILVTLQPTSPLRRAEHIDAAVEIFKDTQADMVMSVCQAEHSPYWMRSIGDDGHLISILPNSEHIQGGKTFLLRIELMVLCMWSPIRQFAVIQKEARTYKRL